MVSTTKKALHTQGVMLLVAIALIWGTAFPLIRDAVGSLSPSALIATRFVVAAVAFVPCTRGLNAHLVRDGALLAFVLFATFATQAIGLETISANRAAFICGLNVVLVPLLGPLLGQRVPSRAFLAAGLALTGIGVMSWEGGVLGFGDLWMFGSALSYAVYILMLEVATLHHPPLSLTAIQLLIMAVLGAVWAAPELAGQLGAIGKNFIALLYLGLVATATTIGLQAVAQRWVPAHETALIYALEPVFAAVFSFWLLGERLGTRGLVGAGLVLAAMVLSQRRR